MDVSGVLIPIISVLVAQDAMAHADNKLPTLSLGVFQIGFDDIAGICSVPGSNQMVGVLYTTEGVVVTYTQRVLAF
ncbi:MAG: hypothetical protein ABI700_10900 [Chloroflexota bacterium]